MMSREKKIRSLILIIIFLLITNIVLLSFFLFSRNTGSDTHELNLVGSFLKDSIGFDKTQMDTYQSLRKTDYEKGKPVFDSIKSAKSKFYENIYSEGVPDSVLNRLAGVIGEKQIAVDKHMLFHFRNLRSVCTPQQLPKFDSLFKNIVEKVTSAKFRTRGNR